MARHGRAFPRRRPARGAAHGDHDDPRRRLLLRHRLRGPPGDPLRRDARPPTAHLRADHLGDRARRPLVHRHVPRGRRRRRRAPRRPRADPPRRGLRQGDDDRRPERRARGPEPRADDARGDRHDRRRGPSHGLPGRRARRGPRGHRDRDRDRHRHDRARHVPQPASGSVGAHGGLGPVPRADAGLLLRRRRRRGPGAARTASNALARIDPRPGRECWSTSRSTTSNRPT